VAISDPIELAAEILTAFVANNSVPRAALAALFEGLHSALKRLVDGSWTGEGLLRPSSRRQSPRCRSASPSRQIICWTTAANSELCGGT
jgi:predicted transcriptional regulator